MKALCVAAIIMLSGCTGTGSMIGTGADIIDARVVGRLAELEQISGTMTEKITRLYMDWHCRRMSIREWTRVWAARSEDWQAMCSPKSTPTLIPQRLQ